MPAHQLHFSALDVVQGTGPSKQWWGHADLIGHSVLAASVAALFACK